MKNRYDNLLREYNKEILDLVPYNPFFFTIAAKEIEKMYSEGDKILEIGTGEGDSALPLLKHTKVKVDLLDISQEMLDIAAKRLFEYKDRTRFICEDANEYLGKSDSYNIIFAGWTLHNFKVEDRKILLESIYKNLLPGGCFILMDKVYPTADGMDMLKKQNERYARYLPKEVADAVITHEIEDASDVYRIDEGVFLNTVKEIGFRDVEIIERLERDIVLIARK